jgi:TetR/AcrR family transcriptional regulator
VSINLALTGCIESRAWKYGMNKRVALKTNKAERTQAAILAAAENHFSRLGYAATRLEDIADELGLTRAALFYYFKDKRTLYDAMLADTFSTFANELKHLLEPRSGTISERLELAAGAWVDAVVSRPNLARLILRFVADGIEQPWQRIFIENDQIPQKFFELFEEGRRTGELKPLHDDPFHFASAIIGTPVFYAAALATVVPSKQFEPLDPAQAAVHRRQTLHLLRNLLGITSSVENIIK